MTVEFIVTSLIVILLPGTGVLYTLAYGLNSGWRASIWAALGCTLGIVPAIVASIVGLAALLHASALAFQVVKYLGVLYLFYLAWTVLRSHGALEISSKRGPRSIGKIVANGFLINILNPKLSLFFLSFLPQFVPVGAAQPTVHMLSLAVIFMVLTFIVFCGYGAFAALARRHVMSRPAILLWFRRGFACAFGALGARLAFADR